METLIVKPVNEILKKYVEYFLFLRKSDSCLINYTTFPNSNLCLAIYKQNAVTYTSNTDTNQCTIKCGNKGITSRIYGFHTMPFNVNIDTDVDQICIVFFPAALRAFTNANFSEILEGRTAFEQLFGASELHSLEKVFDEANVQVRSGLLENLLLKKLKRNVSSRIQEALHFIRQANSKNCDISVEILCEKLNISDTTLFRLFKNELGQNAQKFLKTLRFRRVLAGVLEQQNSLTEVGLCHNYYDQPHFIRDFKAFAGQSPKSLLHQISVQQKDLAWIYKEISNE